MHISKENLDDISELVNIGMGKGAAMLNSLLESHITLNAPVITLVREADLKRALNKYLNQELFAAQMSFYGDFNGDAQLIFSHECAGKLVHALLGVGVETRLDDMDSLRAETLNEVGNIVINSIIGTISNELNLSMKFSIPCCMQGNFENIVGGDIAGTHEGVLHACVHFVVAELKIEGDIIMFLGIDSLRKLVEAIERYRKNL
ncbi:MAG: chemotaxis protein CheC [Deltaproteobacteria bacterium]|nr:chemotaxis protein CheC [Deltaproteobacteria bacterium]